MPQGGAVEYDVQGWVEVTAACAYIWSVSFYDQSNNQLSVSGNGVQRIHDTTTLVKEIKRARWVVTGLPVGTVVTARLRHFATVTSAVTLKAGASNGYFISMSAVSVN